ncbi:MAG: PD-(D/E)XK nuclease family protein [Verrucomicrobia bacterium]|nr:PD-(D/E)XK nuclease family protein [Verrucomicrobiota bacterium]
MIATLLTEPEERLNGSGGLIGDIGRTISGGPTGKVHLSPSRVSRYLLCPEQYRLYYVEKLRPKVPSGSLVFGQVIHLSLAGFFKEKTDPLKTFQEYWTTLKGIPLDYSKQETWEKLNDAGRGLLEKFMTEEAPKLGTISAVEEPFTLSVTGIDLPFIGVIDLVASVATTVTVVDFKTSGSRYGVHEADMSDQLTAYRLAKPQVERLALCVLVKTKEPQIAWQFTRRTGEQLSDYLAKAGYVGREIASARFYKRPGVWCAWCDYLPVCLGDKRKAEQSLAQIG